QAALAETYHNLGAANQEQGRPAREFYEKALALYLPLLRAAPGNVTYAEAAANTSLNVGLCYQADGLTDRAEEAYARAEGLLEPLTRKHPQESSYVVSLAAARANWGLTLRSAGRAEAALEKYTRSVAGLEAVVRREPNHTIARSFLLSACGGRAQTYEA